MTPKQKRKEAILSRILSPFTLPILYFGGAILIGGALLRLPGSLAGEGELAWVDAFFTAASAVCVTGLSVVDLGSTFTVFGQSVIMVLMELGGVGLMTYSSLIFYMWSHKISLANYFALRDSLGSDVAFSLSGFLLRIFGIVLGLELIGAVCLYVIDPVGFHPFSAMFHAVSAFANGGFSLFSDSLVGYRGNWGVNFVIMGLIMSGGIGFAVLAEVEAFLRQWRPWRVKRRGKRKHFSFQSKVILKMYMGLFFGGALILLVSSGKAWSSIMPWDEVCLTALFQSATCRTAGFNTVDIASLSMGSMMVMMILMFIGGGPGSCAGGIKVTTFRTLLAYVVAELRGLEQTVVGGAAVSRVTLRNAITLVVFSASIVTTASFVFSLTDHVYPVAGHGDYFLKLVFDVISAFGTVGLSAGAVEHSDVFHKWVYIFLMFVGRLGPIVFVSMLREWQKKRHFTWPEENLMIG